MKTHSYHHQPGGVPLIGETIDVFLARVARRFPDREALVSLPQGRRLTYSELAQEVQRVARSLMAIGVERGDRVAIWATDNVEWVLLQLATARIGAVLVNINPANKIGELQHALKKARVKDLVLIPSFRKSNYEQMMLQVVPELMTDEPGRWSSDVLSDLRHVILYDAEDPMNTTSEHSGFMLWGSFIEAGKCVSDDDIRRRTESLDPDDPINIQFTSGTTGFPKGVVLTHHNILNNAWWIGEVMHLTEQDRLCVPVPFYHCFGMVVSNLACLTHGSAIIIPAEHFDASATLRAVEQERCTVLHGVPTMFVAELERLDADRYDLSSLRTGIMGGAPCPPELARRIMKDLHIPEILIAYGQTEASPVTHLTHTDDPFERRVGTVGGSMPHQEVKIVDPATDATVPIGEPGEICFRGYHVMRGYFDDPRATAAAIDQAGWLHSGDLGVMDHDGYVRITGRLKDMIIRGGENIYPAEIEAHFYEHPKVAQLAVFGIPDEVYGEEVGAWIKLHENTTAEPEEFQEWAKQRLAHFKIPRHVWIVDDFPMTVTGKIQKYRIRELVAKQMESATPAATA